MAIGGSLHTPAPKDCLSIADINKELGNAALKKGKVKEAADKYREGLRVIELALTGRYSNEWVAKGEGKIPLYTDPSLMGKIVDQMNAGIHVRGEEDDGWLKLLDPEGNALKNQVWVPVNGTGYTLEPVLSEDQRKKAVKSGTALNLNLAQTCLKQSDWKGAVRHATSALESDKDSGKALYRRAVACLNLNTLGKLQQAIADLERAIELEPSSREVHEHLRYAKARLKEFKQWRKDTEAQGWKPILLAAREECAEEVRELLAASASPDEVGLDGSTPLTLAAQHGSVEVVGDLLKAKATVDLVGLQGVTALVLATQSGHAEIVNQLLGAGAKVGLEDPMGGSAVVLAAQQGMVDILGRLLTAKAIADTVTEYNITPLMMAAQTGQIAVVGRLLQAKATVDAQRDDGGNALMLAAQYGHRHVVKQLLKEKADVDVADLNGRGPLMFAVHFDRTDVVDELLSARATVDYGDLIGYTALMLAVQGNHVTALDRLLRAKANPDFEASSGASALRLAAEKGEKKSVSRLLEAKATVDLTDPVGHSALILAAMGGHMEVIEQLLEAKANINLGTVPRRSVEEQLWANKLTLKYQMGKLAFDYCWKVVPHVEEQASKLTLGYHMGKLALDYCWKVDPEMDEKAETPEKEAEAAKADDEDEKLEPKFVESQGCEGSTALMLAAKEGHTAVVEKLLKARATVNMVASNGDDALKIAEASGRHRVAERLRKAKEATR
mmetsp:Transcript_148176/g.258573  ORF Transcript_148176/g.258573 Transcript_148176/m.258573 type:complete len:727 (-) Transcript_148176:68-2248(-)